MSWKQIHTKYTTKYTGCAVLTPLMHENIVQGPSRVWIAMPPVANPNPDRARRAASGAPAAEAKVDSVPEPLLPVSAPAAAPIVASAAPAAGAERYKQKCDIGDINNIV